MCSSLLTQGRKVFIRTCLGTSSSLNLGLLSIHCITTSIYMWLKKLHVFLLIVRVCVRVRPSVRRGRRGRRRLKRCYVRQQSRTSFVTKTSSFLRRLAQTHCSVVVQKSLYYSLDDAKHSIRTHDDWLDDKHELYKHFKKGPIRSWLWHSWRQEEAEVCPDNDVFSHSLPWLFFVVYLR